MKHTVALLLLVAIGHAAEPSRRKPDEDDNSTAKRELLEGNYGLRIQPSILGNAGKPPEPQLDYSRRNTQQKNVPSQEYGPPRAPQQEYGPPLAKISDVLTGQGPSFPAAIAGHLYSPVSVYQPRLGSPTTFEVSQPVPSQLRFYAQQEHKIFNDNFLQAFQQDHDFESLRQQQDYEGQILKNTNQNFNSILFNAHQPLIITEGENYERQENLIQSFEAQKNALNQNTKATKQSNAEQAQLNQQLQNFETSKLSQSEQQQRQNLQQNLPAFTEIRPSRPDITGPSLPRLETFQPQSRPIYSEQIIQQIFPQVEELPSDFFQQINLLGNQLSYNEETVQDIQNPEDEQANREAEIKENEKSEQPDVNQSRQQTDSERKASASQAQSSTAAPNQNTQPQAMSYARFSQGLQLPSNQIQGPTQSKLLQPQPSPLPPPEFLQLPQPQPPQLFEPFLQQPVVKPIQQTTPQPQLQPLPLQALFQPLPPQSTVEPLTSVAPLQPLFTVSNQPPQRVGIVRNRQRTNQKLQNQSTLTTLPQNKPSLTTRPQNNPLLTTRPQNQPTLTTLSQNQQTFSNQQPQVVTSLNTQSTFASQELEGLSNEISTVSTNFAPKSTSESSSQSTESSTTPVSIVPKAKARSTLPASPNSQSQVIFTSTLAPQTLPPQPVTEAPLSTILTSIQPLSTLAPISQPQPTLASLQTSEPRLIELSTQPQIQPTLNPVQVLTSLQPLSTQQPFPVTLQSLATFQPIPVTQQQPQPEIPGIRAIPVQRYQIQSKPLIQVHPIEQQQPLQAQIQFQPTLSPPQQLQIQLQPQSQQQLLKAQTEQQQQSKAQAEQQQQSQSQFAQQQKPQLQSEQQQKAQSDKQQQPQTEQSQQDKEAAINHAQELLYELYSPFLQPVYSESQAVLIQQPHFKAASLAFPSTYSRSFPTFQATPAFSSTQYFGKYAQDIFGGPRTHYHHYKKK